MQQQDIIGAGMRMKQHDSAPMKAFRKSKMGRMMPKKNRRKSK